MRLSIWCFEYLRCSLGVVLVVGGEQGEWG